MNNSWDHSIFESIQRLYFNSVNKVPRMKVNYTEGYNALFLGDGFSDLKR